MSFGEKLDQAKCLKQSTREEAETHEALPYRGITVVFLPMLLLFFFVYVGLEMSMVIFLPGFGFNLAITFAAGWFMSGMFSIGLVYADYLIPGRSERTTSLMIGFGGIGGALLPWLSGWSLDHFDLQRTFLIFAAAVTGLLVLISAMSVISLTNSKSAKHVAKKG